MAASQEARDYDAIIINASMRGVARVPTATADPSAWVTSLSSPARVSRHGSEVALVRGRLPNKFAGGQLPRRWDNDTVNGAVSSSRRSPNASATAWRWPVDSSP